MCIFARFPCLWRKFKKTEQMTFILGIALLLSTNNSTKRKDGFFFFFLCFAAERTYLHAERAAAHRSPDLNASMLIANKDIYMSIPRTPGHGREEAHF